MRLLLVEDDPNLNHSLATQLEQAGYVVDRAADGQEGLYLAREYPIESRDRRSRSADAVRRRADQAGARRRQVVSDARADGARSLAGQGRSAEARRRRLRREAVPRRGAARARRRAAAPRERLGAVGARVRAHRARHAHAGSQGQRREARAHELRVQAARVPDAACGRGAVENADHRGAVRRGLRARQQRDRGVHRAAAASKLDPDDEYKPIETLRGRGYRLASRAGLAARRRSGQSADPWPSSGPYARASSYGSASR